MNKHDHNYNPCPCCRKLTISELGEYEICDYCFWEDDPIQSENPDLSGGANAESLNQARQRFLLAEQ